MNRWSVACILCVLTALDPAARAADDPVRANLDKAKATYDDAVERYQAAVAAWLDKREEAARAVGDKQAVDQVKSDRQAFDEKGEQPKSTPAAVKQRLATARSSLEAVYKAAVREYTKARQDDKASAVEKEMQAFMSRALRPADAVKFRGKYYKAFDSDLPWRQAEQKCKEMGGRLVIIESAEENEFVTRLVADAKLQAVWLGATDEKKEGEWVWVTGKKLTYSNWGPKEPNNSNGLEHRLVLMLPLGFNGRWSDQPDTSPAWTPGFVCEWE